MRFAIAALIVAVSVPAFAVDKKGQCRNRCDSNYQYCSNRATTKQAKKSCKVERKNCKGQCK